jgi:diguanylate cyclase (GGDEF)-like protein/PAS domain S-box-containing protein
LQTILLIQNSDTDSTAVRDALINSRDEPFSVVCVPHCFSALEVLTKQILLEVDDPARIAAVLVDLSLPDSNGIETFAQLIRAAPHIPILILASAQDEDAAKLAVRGGAHEYLLKDRLDTYLLPKAVSRMIERAANSEIMFEEKERAQVTLDSIGDAVVSTDVAGHVTYLNVVAERLTGWSQREAHGRPLEEVVRLIDGATRVEAPNPMAGAIRDNKTVNLTSNCVLISRDGTESPIEDSSAPIHDRHGQVTGAVMVFHDVSAARAATLRISHLAQHDSLTGLPNRMLLKDRLTEAMVIAQRYRRRLAMLFLDVDRFKYINDTLGHVLGDRLLQSIAQRLLACVRASDTVSRQGGDEFVILLSEVAHAQDAAVCADKILETLRLPHRIDQHDLHVTASIGIAAYPDDGTDAETLMKHADFAMYHAKENGRDNRQFFKPDMNLRAIKRRSLENGLRYALEREELMLHYQPNIDLATGTIVAVEALVRWLHPDLGLVSPADFIPVAEEGGLMVPIGQWVLGQACHQAQAWQDIGLAPIRIAVNTSAAELRAKNFSKGIGAILDETGLDPRFLELELTETFLTQDSTATLAVLQDLKQRGLNLALDDFGTGYSSLNHLKRFPIDTLKIDRSFIRTITSNPDDASIVCAVIGLGKNLHMRVVAEGIETHAQLAYLQTRGCPIGQGHYFSQPLPGRECTQLLRRGIAVHDLQPQPI